MKPPSFSPKCTMIYFKKPPSFKSVSVARGGHYGSEVIVALDYDHCVWQLKDGKWKKLDEAWE